eukprot:gene454-823_t
MEIYGTQKSTLFRFFVRQIKIFPILVTNKFCGSMSVLPLVIFDFDWSFVNEDSDSWIIGLVPEMKNLMNELRLNQASGFGPGQWNKLMDYIVGRMMQEFNISIDGMVSHLQGIPFFRETFEAAQLAKYFGSELFILSDANTFYIETILRHHGQRYLFADIISNPGVIEDGILRIKPYHQDLTPHNCPNCPSNMCKGNVLLKLREGYKTNSGELCPIIYIGDGGGDYCAATKLLSTDYLCCRNDWTLHKKVLSSPSPILPKILPWNDGKELLSDFQKIFQDSSIESI